MIEAKWTQSENRLLAECHSALDQIEKNNTPENWNAPDSERSSVWESLFTRNSVW